MAPIAFPDVWPSMGYVFFLPVTLHRQQSWDTSCYSEPPGDASCPLLSKTSAIHSLLSSSRLLPASLSLKPHPASSFFHAFRLAVDGSCAGFYFLGFLHLLPPIQLLFSHFLFLFLTRSLKPPMAEA